MKLVGSFWLVYALCVGVSAFYYFTMLSNSPKIILVEELSRLLLLDFCIIFCIYFLFNLASNLASRFIKTPKTRQILKICSQIVSKVAIALVIFVALVDILLIYNFSAPFSSMFFEVLLNTHTGEAVEFLQSYASVTNLVIIILIPAFCALFYKLKPLEISRKKSIIIFAITFGILAIFSPYRESDSVSVISAHYGERFAPARWIDTLASGAFTKREYLESYNQKVQAGVLKTIECAGEVKQSRKIKNVVLIIGESTQRNYMGVYGYGLPTTPNLQRLRDSGNAVFFSDVVSPYSLTNRVLTRLLTFGNYENSKAWGNDDWFNHLNIVDLMRLAGISSTWISNHDPTSHFGNVARVMVERADNSYMANYGFGENRTSPDGVLLEMYDELKAGKINRVNLGISGKTSESSETNFYVFHIYGTHYSYKKRYPPSFAKFSKEELREQNLDLFVDSENRLNDKQAQRKSEYLNAIYYNDFVVNEIFERFKDEESVIFYVSDHGDEVYDYRDVFSHSESMPSRFAIEIPFVVFMSDEFRRNHAQIAGGIERAKNKPFMSDDFLHLFSDVLGLESKYFDETRSPLRAQFNADRVRFFAGYNYDLDMRDVSVFQKSAPSRIFHKLDSENACRGGGSHCSIYVGEISESSLQNLTKILKNLKLDNALGLKIWIKVQNLDELQNLRILDSENFVIVQSADLQILKSAKNFGFKTALELDADSEISESSLSIADFYALDSENYARFSNLSLKKPNGDFADFLVYFKAKSWEQIANDELFKDAHIVGFVQD